LLSYDKYGFFYFVDRLGDTFRWKGENVATTEVAERLTTIKGVQEANVYGVSIPNKDGRAGMAALVVDAQNFDIANFYKQVVEGLPGYAQPVFLRIQESLDVTATFKLKKVDLIKEGFDPSIIKDPLYVKDDTQKCYVKLDKTTFENFMQNTVSKL